MPAGRGDRGHEQRRVARERPSKGGMGEGKARGGAGGQGLERRPQGRGRVDEKWEGVGEGQAGRRGWVAGRVRPESQRAAVKRGEQGGEFKGEERVRGARSERPECESQVESREDSRHAGSVTERVASMEIEQRCSPGRQRSNRAAGGPAAAAAARAERNQYPEGGKGIQQVKGTSIQGRRKRVDQEGAAGFKRPGQGGGEFKVRRVRESGTEARRGSHRGGCGVRGSRGRGRGRTEERPGARAGRPREGGGRKVSKVWIQEGEASAGRQG